MLPIYIFKESTFNVKLTPRPGGWWFTKRTKLKYFFWLMMVVSSNVINPINEHLAERNIADHPILHRKHLNLSLNKSLNVFVRSSNIHPVIDVYLQNRSAAPKSAHVKVYLEKPGEWRKITLLYDNSTIYLCQNENNCPAVWTSTGPVNVTLKSNETLDWKLYDYQWENSTTTRADSAIGGRDKEQSSGLYSILGILGILGILAAAAIIYFSWFLKRKECSGKTYTRCAAVACDMINDIEKFSYI